MKKFLSIVFSLVIILSTSVIAFASELPSTTTVAAKVAIVTDVSENGDNLTDDQHINSNTTIQDISLDITSQTNDELKIMATIADKKVSVSATPAGKSENGHAIFYEAKSDNPDFEVVNFAYVDNADTNMFFKNYGIENNVNKILKLYLKDLSSTTRDYTMIECFEYEIIDFNSLIATLPINTIMGSWASKEFTPISSNYEDIVPYASTRNTERTYSDTFFYLSETETHTITLNAYCFYYNIPVGRTQEFIHRIDIVGKTTTCPADPTINSKIYSALHVKGLYLTQTTIPNTAFTSTKIDGLVLKNNNDTKPSVSLGIGWYGLSLSLELPSSFSETVDLDSTYDTYVNGRNGNYARSIRTTLKSNYMLTQIGHNFSVTSKVTDFGNVTTKSYYHQASWCITIINANTKTTQTKFITQNVVVAVKD